MSQIKVSAKRHLAKTISYRIISTLIGFLIMWSLTGKIEVGAAFGIIELLYKPIQYYIHERIWYKWISYGLIKVNPVRRVKTKKIDNIPSRKLNEHLQEILSEPRVIKEGVQPEKVIKTEPVMVKESILGISELPEIKRLTYTKKSDN
jgi:uncharacterized membrane protein